VSDSKGDQVEGGAKAGATTGCGDRRYHWLSG
jgi:hypothetical protein